MFKGSLRVLENQQKYDCKGIQYFKKRGVIYLIQGSGVFVRRKKRLLSKKSLVFLKSLQKDAFQNSAQASGKTK